MKFMMHTNNKVAHSEESDATDKMAQSLMDVAIKLQGAPWLSAEQDFIRYALDAAAIVAITDVRGTITYVNSKFCEISGYSEAELIGENHRKLKSSHHDTAFFRAMYREIAHGRVWHGEICNRRKDGSLYWVDTTIVPHLSEAGKADSYTSIRFDITARKQLEADLRASREHQKRIASLDPLTNLPNRRSFQENLEATVDDFVGSGRAFHLALLDVDTFKEVNDSFGHSMGDHLLQTVASRLGELCQGRGFIARLGGDEFGIILLEGTPSAARAFFEETLEVARRPIQIGAAARRFSLSLGVAVFPENGNDAENLFQAADLALYHAKSLGRDRFELFHPKLKEVAEYRSQLLLEIEDGLRLDAFELYYQPIVPAVGSGLISLEALMRWRHPQHGLLTPSNFQEGFSDPVVRAAIGMFVLERSFKDIADMTAEQLPLERVAINLTNSDFRSDAFVDQFFELSAETGIPLEKFCVEVTESMFLGSHQKRVKQGLHRLHDAGVEIAFDDFGTGYASLTHLRQLPIDKLKIDRSFVANMVTCQEDQAIIRGVIDIAHSLGKTVTAEGVETMEQVELLTEMKCDHLQGWYFSTACPPGHLPRLIGSMRATLRAV
ncbi:putative bifunctional diguanylate cyclase/phosphodiesterase [Shinella granuli]|nr:EAL domain-containing protein [Shinella granuli]